MLSPQMEQAMQAMGSLLPKRCCAMLSCDNLTLHRTQIAFNSWFWGDRTVIPIDDEAARKASLFPKSLCLGSEPTRARLRPLTFPICFLSAFCYLKLVSSWGYSSVGRASRSQ